VISHDYAARTDAPLFRPKLSQRAEPILHVESLGDLGSNPGPQHDALDCFVASAFALRASVG
jgi:hypothetical protein